MTFKPKGNGIDYKKLQNTLVNSKVHEDNKALYQLLKDLINGASDFQSGIDSSIKKGDALDLSNVSNPLSAQDGGIESNYYLPNIFPLNNVTAFAEFSTRFQITQRIIQVFGKLSIQPTAAGVLTELDLELPISSVFTLEEQVQGVINGVSPTTGFAGIVIANLITLNAKIRFFPTSNDLFNARFIINYERLKV